MRLWRPKFSFTLNVGTFIVLAIAAHHMVQGGAILLFPAAAGASSVSSIVNVLGGSIVITGWVLMIASVLALTRCIVSNLNVRLAEWTLVPQQLILMLVAGGSLYFAFTGHFADGVPRPVAFILIDQLFPITTLFMHIVGLWVLET